MLNTNLTEMINDAIEHLVKLQSRSNDPNTKCAAIIFDHEGFCVGSGYNYNLMPGHNNKYETTIHAEIKAIIDSAGYGEVMYTSHLPCHHCMKAIIEKGIDTIYTINSPFSSDKWERSKEISLKLAKEHGIKIEYIY